MELDRRLKGPPPIFQISGPLLSPPPPSPVTNARSRAVLTFLFLFNHKGQDSKTPSKRSLPTLRRENLRSPSSCGPARLQTCLLVPQMV